MEENRETDKISRKKFLYWLVPVAGSAVIALSFRAFYSGIANKYISVGEDEPGSRLARKHRKKLREAWLREQLVLNSKTNVVHYPSKSIFTYYSKITDQHVVIVDFAEWKQDVVHPKHFNKSKSGIVLERLALKELSPLLLPQDLGKATDTLAIAFSGNYKNKNNYQMNTCNWRLYHLLLQLIALNQLISVNDKWQKFSEIIREVDLRSVKILPKNAWIRSEAEFEKRVGYIVSHADKYKERLKKRI